MVNAYQEANRAFFKLSYRFLSSRIARSQFRVKNEATELLLIHTFAWI